VKGSDTDANIFPGQSRKTHKILWFYFITEPWEAEKFHAHIPLKINDTQLKKLINQAWWHTPVIPALRRLRQKDHKFEASLCYIAKLCFKKPNIIIIISKMI
jgi:hypothetical protein